jgi:hypothetical protein
MMVDWWLIVEGFTCTWFTLAYELTRDMEIAASLNQYV